MYCALCGRSLILMWFSFISTNSLKEILKELDNKLSDEELEGIIDEVDTDGSGTLDFDGRISGILSSIKYF